jgi:acyl carrier protein
MIQQCTVETVIDVLQEKVGVPSNTPNIETATWEELGVESLGLVETFASLERLLGIKIPDKQAMQTKNIHELVALINA